jgi:hypothetical protein
MALIDRKGRPWACVAEVFTAPDADAIDRALEYVGRYRNEMRHGPHGKGKFPFLVALVFLTGAVAEPDLDFSLPEQDDEVAEAAGAEAAEAEEAPKSDWSRLLFRPRVIRLCEEDGVACLDAAAQNKGDVWLPLMKGGQTLEAAKRFRDRASRIRTS